MDFEKKETISIDLIDNTEKYMAEMPGLWRAVDSGSDIKETDYCKLLIRCRNGRTHSKEELVKIVLDKVKLYKDVKKNGVLGQIKVDSDNKIIEGHHRFSILKHLDYKTINIIRV